MKYCYNEQDGLKIVSEEDIIRDYFPYWSDKMKKAGKEDKINHENCINDWVITHWAWEHKE
jgi:hypothetical protein